MVTIKDVAKKANTSIATVSRVLNNLGGYSEQTKENVLRIADRLGYESNANARSLKINKTNTLGIVFPNISSMITYEFLNGIEEIAYKNNYSVIVSYTYSQPNRMMKALRTLYEKRVDGIIFTSDVVADEYLEYLEKINMPVVLLSTKSDKSSIPYVKVDDYSASYDTTRYLIKKGHHDIAMICGNLNDLIAGKPRLEGYKKALIDADISVKESLIQFGNDFSFDDGRDGLKRLFKQKEKFTAVFAVSDEMASGVQAYALKKGIKVPEELSIVGYDDTSIAEFVYPPLTVLSQPLREMGTEAIKMLIRVINGEDNVKSKVLTHSIKERKSVRKLN